MDQVNVNAGPPPRPPAPPRPAWWPIALFVLLLVIVAAVGFAVRYAGSHGSAHATATPGTIGQGSAPTPTGAAGQIATGTPAAVATATGTPAQLATGTVVPASGSATGTVTPAAAAPTAAPPTNPTALHVNSGSCVDHRIIWSWAGAQRATSYEVVLYNPRNGATIKDTSTTVPSYALTVSPGTRVGLRVRSRNAAGAPRHYTAGSVGRVPPITTNPTAMRVSTFDHKITWSWTGARHATAYDLVLYHYQGSAARTDLTTRIDQGQWGTTVTPGTAYYLKVRSVGPCPPSTFFTPPVHATAGATPTPGT